MQANLIATCGLSDEENTSVKKYLPQKNCEIMCTDDVRDVIATNEFAVIMKVDAISKVDMEMLLSFYEEIVPFSETVVFIGDMVMPESLKNHITLYKDFEMISDNLKYILLSAYRKQKKSENFSASLANAIMILSEIRKKPFITSSELAQKLEMSQRSIQRYIETLRVAGEWIEYDTVNKGWKLCEGKSVLWGDF